ncbi:MAG: putative transposase [Paracoccaceae bacterium]|jgi:putative transposase
MLACVRGGRPAKGHKTYPYLLTGLRVERPNQVWCADITYLPMRRGFLCLVAIRRPAMVCLQTMRGMAWSTRKVLAWRISNTLEADFCIEAMNEAIHRFGPPEIMNTDHPLVVCRQTPAHCPAGYACMPERGAGALPVHVLRLDRPTAPFRRADLLLGDCMQSPAGNAWTAKAAIWTPSSLSVIARNHLSAPIERLWRSLRYECVYLHAWETGSQARAGVGDWIALLQPPAAPRRPWRTAARHGLLRHHRNRSAGAGSSLNQPEICPKDGEHLSPSLDALCLRSLGV